MPPGLLSIALLNPYSPISLHSRGSPKESPQKVSARPVRQLKINSSEPSSPSPSSKAAVKTPKDRSPKVTERRSPRSPIPEVPTNLVFS